MIWSFSFLRDMANCPHKAYRKYVSRDLPKEDTPELREGIITHKLLEDYISSKGKTRLPVELEMHAKPLVNVGAVAEIKLGMTEDMRRAQFFGRGADEPWGRGKADVVVLNPPTAVIFDWKTGRVREDDRELRCLSLLLRANYPTINRVIGHYVWLKTGKLGTAHDVTDVNQTYHGIVASMAGVEARVMQDAKWEPTPNPLCSWCPVADCRFNSRREA